MVMAMIATLPAADLGKWEEVVKVVILLLGLDSTMYLPRVPAYNQATLQEICSVYCHVLPRLLDESKR